MDSIELKFPFLTGIQYLGNEFVGIVTNFDNQVLSFYNISDIQSEEEKKLLLDLGESWWWGSNRVVPINIFMRYEMRPFKHHLKTFIAKDVTILFGPTTNLQDILKKRVKRKSIQLIRKD